MKNFMYYMTVEDGNSFYKLKADYISKNDYIEFISNMEHYLDEAGIEYGKGGNIDPDFLWLSFEVDEVLVEILYNFGETVELIFFEVDDEVENEKEDSTIIKLSKIFNDFKEYFEDKIILNKQEGGKQ